MMRKLEHLENAECCRCSLRVRMLESESVCLDSQSYSRLGAGSVDLESQQGQRIVFGNGKHPPRSSHHSSAKAYSQLPSNHSFPISGVTQVPSGRYCSPRLMCLVVGFLLGLLFTTSCFLTLAVQSCVYHMTVGCRTEIGSPLPSADRNQLDQGVRRTGEAGVNISLRSHAGAFWPESVEALRPSGFGVHHHNTWRRRLSGNRVARIQQGCGRMHNRMIVFEDGAIGCLRYRVNTDQIQGEIFTYHFARLLGINNIPPSILIRLNSNSPTWSAVRDDYASAEWEEGRLAVLAEWIPGLQAAYIPKPFRRSEINPSLPPTVSKDLLLNGTALLSSASDGELKELVQWTDLLALDYLTANLDRFVNSLINRQWNDQIMTEPAHNLEMSPDKGLLVFLDNESGLFHGYRLLSKYWDHYESMLRLSCLFRRPLIDALRRLPTDHVELEKLLTRTVHAADPTAEQLPKLSKENASILTQRIKSLLNHVDSCDKKV